MRYGDVQMGHSLTSFLSSRCPVGNLAYAAATASCLALSCSEGVFVSPTLGVTPLSVSTLTSSAGALIVSVPISTSHDLTVVRPATYAWKQAASARSFMLLGSALNSAGITSADLAASAAASFASAKNCSSSSFFFASSSTDGLVLSAALTATSCASAAGLASASGVGSAGAFSWTGCGRQTEKEERREREREREKEINHTRRRHT